MSQNQDWNQNQGWNPNQNQNPNWNQNQMWNQNQNSDFNQDPYVSNYDQSAVHTREELYAVVASRSFLVVFIGMIITTITAYVTVSNMVFLLDLILNKTFYAFLIAEVVIVLISSWAVRKKMLGLAAVTFLAYTIVNGITLSIVFIAYDCGTVQKSFLLAALVFGGMSAYGYFTKRDLTTVGSFCGMALLGAILVSLANILFFHSSGMDLLMDYIVVFIFVGLTAFDMWRMKKMTNYVNDNRDINQIALFTGMELYLDFINLFLRILSIMGRKR